jgi:hypothetical protein
VIRSTALIRRMGVSPSHESDAAPHSNKPDTAASALLRPREAYRSRRDAIFASTTSLKAGDQLMGYIAHIEMRPTYQLGHTPTFADTNRRRVDRVKRDERGWVNQSNLDVVASQCKSGMGFVGNRRTCSP